MKKILTLSTAALLTLNLNAQPPTIYECDSIELHTYISANTAALRSPSPIPVADEVHAAIIEAKFRDAKAEDHCLAIWGNAEFDFASWQTIKDGIDNALDVLTSSSTYARLADGAKKMARKAFEELKKQIEAGICSSLSPNQVMQHLNSAIKAQVGYNLDDLKQSPQSLVNQQIEGQKKQVFKNNAKYIDDPKNVNSDLKDETEKNIRKKSKSFWGG